MTDKVKVRITANQRISYRKVIEIPLEAFQEYESAVQRDEDDSWFAQWADGFLDPLSDENDFDDYEDVEAEEVVP